MPIIDKITENLHNALDRRESDHAINTLNRFLRGEIPFFSERRKKELGCVCPGNSSKNDKYPSVFAIYGGLHTPSPWEKRFACIALLEYCRSYPEHSQMVIGIEAEPAWAIFCKETL
jgi:hypothetical protein